MSKFITIEGVEGVGKSTVIAVIQETLQQAGIDYVFTREPGGTVLAEGIRELLLKKQDEFMLPLTEALLFFAGRLQNIAHVIQPALSRGQWVISDRFTDSSLAYQGAGRGVSADQLQALTHWVQGDLKPDLTILLDAPVEVGLSRIQARSKDRIEEEQIDFFERVREAYLTLADHDPGRYCVVDASQPVDHVHADVIAILKEVMLA